MKNGCNQDSDCWNSEIPRDIYKANLQKRNECNISESDSKVYTFTIYEIFANTL